jgi:hypothetical protein
MIETDLKEAQTKAHDQHSEEMKLLLEQASALELRAAKMAQEHQEEEDGLRKKKCKMAAEVATVVEKFDSEMETMEGELRILEETFRKEREQCEQFNEHFLKVGSGRWQVALRRFSLAVLPTCRSTRSNLASTRRSACWRRFERGSGRSKWFVAVRGAAFSTSWKLT